ncbi:MAG: ribonuclease P protein component [Acholeplasma sp.]
MKRIYSIKSKDELDLVFKEKRSVGNGYFVIYYQAHEGTHFKYAISIGKKYGNAVNRNQAKRRIRYIVSKLKDKFKNNYKFVVVVRQQSSNLSYKEMESNIYKLLHKAKLIEKEEASNA